MPATGPMTAPAIHAFDFFFWGGGAGATLVTTGGPDDVAVAILLDWLEDERVVDVRTFLVTLRVKVSDVVYYFRTQTYVHVGYPPM